MPSGLMKDFPDLPLRGQRRIHTGFPSTWGRAIVSGSVGKEQGDHVVGESLPKLGWDQAVALDLEPAGQPGVLQLLVDGLAIESGAGFEISQREALDQAQRVEHVVEGSLRRLKTDYIDLYQLHWSNRGAYHFRDIWRYDPRGTARTAP